MRQASETNGTAAVKRAVRLGWDEMSPAYQAETRISLDDVHYAPLCPGERELRLIGDPRGVRAIELACGAAQNSIALAKQGARPVAIDISARQLAAARALARQEAVAVDLLQADIERLAMLPDAAFDLALSCFGFEFLPDPAACLAECARLLRPGATLIVGAAHPLTAFEWDPDDRALRVTDYFNPPVEVWDEPTQDPQRKGLTFFRTMQEMFDSIRAAGFNVERVLEPCPYPVPDMTAAEKRAIPYGGPYWESQYDRLSKVPFAAIYRARRL